MQLYWMEELRHLPRAEKCREIWLNAVLWQSHRQLINQRLWLVCFPLAPGQWHRDVVVPNVASYQQVEHKRYHSHPVAGVSQMTPLGQSVLI
jgi:hypothetical protein